MQYNERQYWRELNAGLKVIWIVNLIHFLRNWCMEPQKKSSLDAPE